MYKICVAFVLIFSSFVYGSDSTDFQFKTHSIQFEVNSLFNISDFQGTLISYKYHFSNAYALRFGIDFRADVNGGDYDRTYSTQNNDFIQYSQEIRNYDINLLSQFLKYPNARNDIKTFFGAGPYFSLRSRRTINKDVITGNNVVGVERYYDFKETFIGLSGVIGAEWFFLRNLSLTAEYSFFAAYHTIKNTREVYLVDNSDINSDVDKRTGLYSQSLGAKLGLTVYF